MEANALASEVINRLRSLYKKAPPKQELVAINNVIGEMARNTSRTSGKCPACDFQWEENHVPALWRHV